jgi:WD40 repeat protein
VDLLEKVRQTARYHDAAINFIQFNPSDNGASFATCSDDCHVKIWDFDTGELIHDLSDVHDQPVYALAYNGNGDFLLSGGLDKRIVNWDVVSGSNTKMKIKRHNFSVESIVFSPKSDYVVTTSRDLSWKLWEYSSPSVKEKYKIPNAHFSYVMSAAFSPDGDKLITGSFDREIRLWKIDNGERLKIFEPKKSDVDKKKKAAGSHEKSITRVAWSSKNAIASIDVDGLVKIWSPEGEEVHSFEAHKGGNHVEFTNDGSKLVTTGEDSLVNIWNVGEFSKINSFSADGLNIKVASFNKDGSRLVYGDESGRIFLANLD